MNARGDFGFQPLISTYAPRLAEMDPRAIQFGMSLQAIYVYGAFRDLDGGLYGLIRKFVGPLTTGLGLMTVRDGGLRLDPASFRGARGASTRKLTAEAHTYEGQRMPGDEPFTIRVTDREMSWSEGELMSLDGTLGAPAIQIYIPSHEESAMYASQIYPAGGTILGRPVTGFMLFDQSYMPPGIDWKDSRVFNDLEYAWGSFATEYADGSLEWGHVCLGRRRFSFAAIADREGEVLFTTDVTGGVDVGADDWAERISLRAANQDWEWIPDADGRLTDFSAARPGYFAQTGWARRVGEGRTATRWFAWQETFPERLRSDGFPSTTSQAASSNF
ncbi:MAG: hypothetical protein ACRDKG_02100 [Actinomycetota bacterium]